MVPTVIMEVPKGLAANRRPGQSADEQAHVLANAMAEPEGPPTGQDGRGSRSFLDRLPAWIAAAASTSTALGLVVYAILRVDYSLFYGRFGLKPEDVGLSQLEIVSQAVVLVLTFGVAFLLELLLLWAILWVVARDVRGFLRTLRTEERERTLFGAAVLFVVLIAAAIARSAIGMWALLASVGALMVLVIINWARIVRAIRPKADRSLRGPKLWRVSLRPAIELTAGGRSTLLLTVVAVEIGFLRNLWATLLVLAALLLVTIILSRSDALDAFSDDQSGERDSRARDLGHAEGAQPEGSEDPEAMTAGSPREPGGLEETRAGKLSPVATRHSRALLVALFLITLAFSETVLVLAAVTDAEFVLQGRVVQGTAGPRIPIVSWSARPAAISWMNVPPKGLEDIANHCLLYLGQGGGLAAFFDHDSERTLRIPVGALVISVDASAEQGERAC